ncbi:class I SAM-dependent methyltransferase [Kyrpidia spormannii]|nr:class I SAM-dependent methyltransferase [Kyrpidia spormannii]
MRYGSRLARVEQMVPRCRIVADIGSDHGMLACRLIETGRAQQVIAVEKRPGPYARTRACVRARLGGEAPVSVRLGDGLDPLEPGEVEVVVLAGMGGLTIMDILRRGMDKLGPNTLVVAQPMKHADALRRWWQESGWRVTEEGQVEDRGRRYEVMAAMKPDAPGESFFRSFRCRAESR